MVYIEREINVGTSWYVSRSGFGTRNVSAKRCSALIAPFFHRSAEWHCGSVTVSRCRGQSELSC